MKPVNVFAAISRQRPLTFNVSYAPTYKTFILHHVLADLSHPLHETQRRRQRERAREGLWWHVTTGVDLSKSSCVRAWARRRLRNAFVDELKLRGYDDEGKPLPQPVKLDQPVELVQPATFPAPAIPNLTGSLRLHVQLPLIPAKFLALRAEAGAIIDLLVLAANTGHVPAKNIRKPVLRPSTKPPASKAPSPKPTKVPQPKTASSTPPPPRKTAPDPSSLPRFKRIIPNQ